MKNSYSAKMAGLVLFAAIVAADARSLAIAGIIPGANADGDNAAPKAAVTAAHQDTKL